MTFDVLIHVILLVYPDYQFSFMIVTFIWCIVSLLYYYVNKLQEKYTVDMYSYSIPGDYFRNDSFIK